MNDFGQLGQEASIVFKSASKSRQSKYPNDSVRHIAQIKH
jgi:hypothetical protein